MARSVAPENTGQEGFLCNREMFEEWKRQTIKHGFIILFTAAHRPRGSIRTCPWWLPLGDGEIHIILVIFLLHILPKFPTGEMMEVTARIPPPASA